MDARQVTLVQDSFAAVLPLSDAVARQFYATLFARAPDVRPLFQNDMEAQGEKLMMTLATVVDSLGRIDDILPVVRELAVRHVRYGTREAHYDAVGAALIDTLRAGLGAHFTPEVEAAWGAAYQLLAETMIEAMRKAA